MTDDHLTTKHPQLGLDLVAHGSSVLLLSGAVNLARLPFLCFGLEGLLVCDSLRLFDNWFKPNKLTFLSDF